MRWNRIRARAALGVVCLLAPAGARASGLVTFTDGRSLEVASVVERTDATTLLHFEGGGSVAVPSHRVANWTVLAEEASAPRPRPQAVGSSAAWRHAAGPFAEVIGAAAVRHRVDPVLLTALAQVESALDPRAVSPKGASGLMQLMPATAERFGVDDVFDVAQNVDGGARYLAWLLERFEGRTELALAGYNAGEGAVDRHGGIPPYRETRSYVSQVLAGAGRLEAPAE